MTGRSNAQQRWAVVGGGFLGASLASQLIERGHAVTLFEARDHVGGLADGWSITTQQQDPGNSAPAPTVEVASQLTWDRFYHVILMSDLRLRALLEQLDLADDVQWQQTRTGFYVDKNLYSMSNSLEFLTFPCVRLVDKLRLALTIMIASRKTDWRSLEAISVVDWLKRWSGQQTLEKIWRPLLKAKLGDLYKETSAAFIWSTINRMYAARRSGLKQEMFGYVNGGYAVIVRALHDHLVKQGIDVRTSLPVQSILREDGGFQVAASSGVVSRFDRVVVAAHSPHIPHLCPQLNPLESKRMTSVAYLGVVCVSVVLNKPLSGYYVTNITDDWVPFTGVIEMSALIDENNLQGKGLVYLPKYIQPDDPLFDASDDDIINGFLQAFLTMYPRVNREDVVATRVARARHVMAVPTINYSASAPPVKTSIEGLYVATTAQILFGTLNVNETLLLADRVMTEIDRYSVNTATDPSSVSSTVITTATL